jgi:copper chaperone NosL
MKILLIVALLLGSLWGYAMDYDKESECVVRKLKVYKEPQWVSKIELTNGKKLFFSSPKSMIEFYHQPGRWHDIGVKGEDDFKELLVTDHNTLKPIDAKGAFYVFGSSKTSPAGDDLVPFASYEDAKTFSEKNNGKRVLGFKEIKEALIRLLNNRI